jgi:hypothetical protein
MTYFATLIDEKYGTYSVLGYDFKPGKELQVEKEVYEYLKGEDHFKVRYTKAKGDDK